MIIIRKIQTILFIFFLLICGSRAFAQTAEIYQKAADGYQEDKNYQAAYDSYTKAIKKTGDDKIKLSVLYYKRGESLSGLNKTDAALKDYTMSISLNQLNSDAYWGRGVIYDKQSSYPLALTDYEKAISLIKGENESGLAILYCNLANIHYQLKNYPRALEEDSISLSLNNQYSRAYKIKGLTQIELKKYDQATEDFTKAIFSYTKYDDKNELSFLYSLRADAQRLAKKYKNAINDYTLAININTDNAHAYWNRASTYYSNKDYELAANDYTKAIAYYKNDSTLSKLYDDRAKNEMGQTLYNKAIQDDSVAIALNPNNKIAYFDLASAYNQRADYQLGINALNKLITLNQGQNKLLAIIYYEIANDEYFLNQFDNVIADCAKAIDLYPAYSAPYYYRAKVYLKKINNKQLAISDFNKVLQLDTSKKSVDYIFSLLYLGRSDEAIGILQNKLLQTTDNAAILEDYYNLACLYSLMNKSDEANIYLKKAIDNGYAKKYAVADEDLDNIRNTDDYKTTMGIGKSQ